MRRVALLGTFSLVMSALAAGAGVDVNDLLKRAVANTVNNWKEAPNYVFTEHDIERKLDAHGQVKTTTDKSYEVHMIDGSQYNRWIAVTGHPLSPEQVKVEQRKM